jgi:hypothetical protein
MKKGEVNSRYLKIVILLLKTNFLQAIKIIVFNNTECQNNIRILKFCKYSCFSVAECRSLLTNFLKEIMKDLTSKERNSNMQNHNVHSIHSHHDKSFDDKEGKQNIIGLSISATFHCLIGCGLGEITGMVIGTGLHMNMIDTTILSIILGFIGGMLIGVVPLLKVKFTIRNAFKTVFLAEGLSIAVMEAFEVMTQWMIPGVMEAHLTDWIFWTGMLAALAVGFIAALPVNYIMIKRGIRHQH